MFSSPSKRTRIISAVATSLLLIGVVGCADESDPAEPVAPTTPTSEDIDSGPIDGSNDEANDSGDVAQEEQSDSDYTIPNDFPDDVPLIDGPILLSASGDLPGGRNWEVNIGVDDGESTMNELRSQFAEAGFEEEQWITVPGNFGGRFSMGDLSANVREIGTADGDMISYLVSREE